MFVLGEFVVEVEILVELLLKIVDVNLLSKLTFFAVLEVVVEVTVEVLALIPAEWKMALKSCSSRS